MMNLMRMKKCKDRDMFGSGLRIHIMTCGYATAFDGYKEKLVIYLE
jgi:hypothetical protein